jgi:3-oxoacyl-[acyl-carrier-protein] synthase-3
MQVWSPPAYVQSAFGPSRAPALGASATCGGGLAAFEVAAIITQARGETVAVATSDMWAAPLVNRWHTMPAFGLGDGAGAAILTTDELGAMARLLACETLTDSSLEAGARTPLPFIPGDTRPINFRERKDAYIAAMPGDDLDAKEKAFNAKRDAGLCAAVAATLRQAGENARSFDFVIPSFLGRAMVDREFVQPLSRLGFVPAQFEPACELGLSIGHVGAGDPFIALDLLRSTAQLTKGSNVLVLGVGGGYTWTAAALNIIH